MTKNITTENLIQFAYQETSTKETHRIIDTLSERPDLNQELNDILMVQRALGRNLNSPSNTSVALIMESLAGDSEEVLTEY